MSRRLRILATLLGALATLSLLPACGDGQSLTTSLTAASPAAKAGTVERDITYGVAGSVELKMPPSPRPGPRSRI